MLALPGDVGMLARDLARDLSVAWGTLSEIETCWRRTRAPAGEPRAGRALLLLLSAARQMEADARSLAAANLGERADLALGMAERFGQLRADIASVQLIAYAAGTSPAGDAELWNAVDDVLGRAGARLLSLVLAVSQVKGWSVNRAPQPGAPKPWILLELR